MLFVVSSAPMLDSLQRMQGKIPNSAAGEKAQSLNYFGTKPRPALWSAETEKVKTTRQPPKFHSTVGTLLLLFGGGSYTISK